jgi:hypothetical protein
MAKHMSARLKSFGWAVLRRLGKVKEEQIPPLFYIDVSMHEYKGSTTGKRCAITGQHSYYFDLFRNEHGEAALVSANASYKIQNFIRNREVRKISGPMEFIIYGHRVRIVDWRIEGKARAATKREESPEETPAGDAASA